MINYQFLSRTSEEDDQSTCKNKHSNLSLEGIIVTYFIIIIPNYVCDILLQIFVLF